jgi:hypothetical protein
MQFLNATDKIQVAPTPWIPTAQKQGLQLKPLSLSQSRGDYFFAAVLAFFAGALAATLATGLAADFAFA